MKPLLILLIVFIISLSFLYFSGNIDNYKLGGNIAMSAMLIFTAIGHFVFIKGMAMMIPGFIPGRKTIIIMTGLMELAGAAGLLIVALRHATGIALLIFFLLIVPANIYAAIKKVDYQKATFNGPGISYLWFRIPMQLLLILWIWYFSI